MNTDNKSTIAYCQRWDIHQRIQHLLLLFSVTVLVTTGLPLRFAGAPGTQTIIQAVGGAYWASIIHRIAASILILDAIYHLVYIGARYSKKHLGNSMLPGSKDISDAIQAVLYNLGFKRERPKYGRYSFDEKFEYWAMVWGTVVMIGTGLMLWDPVLTANHLPVVLLQLSRVVHGYEAILAFLSLIIWHFYHAHLKPGAFPMSKVWITGCVTIDELKDDHTLEYEELYGKVEDEKPENEGS